MTLCHLPHMHMYWKQYDTAHVDIVTINSVARIDLQIFDVVFICQPQRIMPGIFGRTTNQRMFTSQTQIYYTVSNATVSSIINHRLRPHSISSSISHNVCCYIFIQLPQLFVPYVVTYSSNCRSCLFLFAEGRLIVSIGRLKWMWMFRH